jgi:phosphoribosylamine-glycine ligase
MFLGIGIDENDKPWILEINTRSGDPELNAILPEITTSLSELFYCASSNTEMPLIKRNDKKVVTMRLVNKFFDWTKPASLLPKFPTPAEDYGITYSLQGLENNNYYLNHSLFTAADTSHEEANKKILKYLDSQYLGQFKVRRDIGILK